MQPIIDTFLNEAVALTGCHSFGLARASCEYDLLVVTENVKPSMSMRVGEKYSDIFFLSREDVMNPPSPELAVALSSLVPLRDSTWTLSTAASASKAMMSANAKRSAESRLSSAVKWLGRAEEALRENSSFDADFWLTAAGYDFALASLYSAETTPSPSHILMQMKGISRKGEGSFTEWSSAVGLEGSSRSACERRLEGLSTVYDIITTRVSEGRSSKLVEARRSEHALAILRAKSRNLIESLQPVDCYAYLGYDAVNTIFALLELQAIRESAESEYQLIISSLTKGRLGIISEDVVSLLGWTRNESTISRGIELLREAISDEAKRI